MRFIIITLIFLISGHCWGQSVQEKGLEVITVEAAKAHIGFLAHDELEGREAGSRMNRIVREYIVSRLTELGVQPVTGSYLQPFHAYRRVGIKGRELERFRVHPDSIRKIQTGEHHKLEMFNVLGMIEGENRNEYIVIGAHYDHLGIDPLLAGDQIYNGADDNASGVSAVLQIAKAFVATGIQPKKNIIFAFWDGEEKGLLGSSYFVQGCSFLANIKSYTNFDMIGRNNDENKPQAVVYFYTQSYPVFEKIAKKNIKEYRLQLQPDYRGWDNPVGGSDNGPFAKEGVPIIWYHTDGHPDYHRPSDHMEKINWDKLVNITKSAFLNNWYLANEY